MSKFGDIDGIFAGINTRLRKLKTEIGIETVERARARTPVVTGEMQEGWGFTVKATDIEFWNTSDHSVYVEFGTEKMAPQAPMRTTLREMEDIVLVALERAKK